MAIDVERTRQYYAALPEGEVCSCAYCRNYCLQIRKAYPRVTAWLEEMGIDPEKPFETLPLEPDEQGMLAYCGAQYLVLGSVPEDFPRKIGDTQLDVADSHPTTGVRQEHFVLELYPIRLKWVMEPA